MKPFLSVFFFLVLPVAVCNSKETNSVPQPTKRELPMQLSLLIDSRTPTGELQKWEVYRDEDRGLLRVIKRNKGGVFHYHKSGATLTTWIVGDDGEMLRNPHVEVPEFGWGIEERLQVRCLDIFPIIDPLLGHPILSGNYTHEVYGDTIRFTSKSNPSSKTIKKYVGSGVKVTGTATFDEDGVVQSCEEVHNGSTKYKAVVKSQEHSVSARVFDLPNSAQAALAK